MTINAARGSLAGFLLIPLLTLIFSSVRAQSLASSSASGNSSSPQTQSNPTRTNPPASASSNALAQPDAVKWTDVGIFIVMIFGIVLQLVISAIGFWLVWKQIKLLREQLHLVRNQIGQLNQGIQGETHSRLYDHYLKVTERMAAQPHLRKYFYEAVELQEGEPECANQREAIDAMSEIVAGLLEHATVQRNNLPKDSWKACWQAYTFERFKKSFELRKFFRENYEWYASSFRDVVASEFPHLIRPCACAPAVAARQKDCPRPEPAATSPAQQAGKQNGNPIPPSS